MRDAASGAYGVVVVDDFLKWRIYVRSVLAMNKQLRIAGEAADGPEAIRSIVALMPDLVLLDISLPTVNGIEVLKHIGKTVPTAKVLFLTNNTDSTVVDGAMRHGACGYVFKAYAGRDLLLAIDAVLRGSKFFSRKLQRAPVENNSLGPVRRPD